MAEIAIYSVNPNVGSIVLYKNDKSKKTKKITPKVGKYNGVSLKQFVQFTYKSEKSSIVKVSKSGKVTAKKKGSTVIYVTAEAGGWSRSWTVNVTVK